MSVHLMDKKSKWNDRPLKESSGSNKPAITMFQEKDSKNKNESEKNKNS